MFGIATLTDVNFTTSGDIVLMTLVGGMGTIFGPAVGALVLKGMENYLAGIGSWVTVVQGCIFVVCVLGVPPRDHRGDRGEVEAGAVAKATLHPLHPSGCGWPSRYGELLGVLASSAYIAPQHDPEPPCCDRPLRS